MNSDHPDTHSKSNPSYQTARSKVVGSFREEHEFKASQRITRLKELENGITALAAHMDAAMYRWLEMVREFDAGNGWVGDGMKSCAHWLNWKCGLNLGAARERVRVAHALPALPQTSELFRRGRLSFAEVRAITRVATPANEEVLLNIALHGTAWHVEQAVSAWRRELRLQALQRDNRRHDNRELRWHWDDEGCLVVQARLTPEQGALFQQAIAASMQQLFDEQKGASAETSRPLSCDSGLVHWLNKKGEPLSIGRKSRTVPPAMHRALRRRDKTCRFPGCTCTRFVDAHHIHHWVDGGETGLDNLVMLCRAHHRLVHEGGFQVAKRPGGGFNLSIRMARKYLTCRKHVSAETLLNRRTATLRPV